MSLFFLLKLFCLLLLLFVLFKEIEIFTMPWNVQNTKKKRQQRIAFDLSSRFDKNHWNWVRMCCYVNHEWNRNCARLSVSRQQQKLNKKEKKRIQYCELFWFKSIHKCPYENLFANQLNSIHWCYNRRSSPLYFYSETIAAKTIHLLPYLNIIQWLFKK